MAFCGFCGEQLGDEGFFCGKCGAKRVDKMSKAEPANPENMKPSIIKPDSVENAGVQPKMATSNIPKTIDAMGAMNIARNSTVSFRKKSGGARLYKTVAGPVALTIGAKDSFSEAVRMYADIINREAAGGWELERIQEVPVIKNRGCLAGILELFGLGKMEEQTTFNMLVFSREA